MNLHFLELFYYVARHGGISAAVRHIPYGIQQPAVSTQVGKLEHDLGVRLFERTPFRLTPAGESLYEYVAPFFDRMPKMAAQLRAAETRELRLGGAELVLRDHLPAVLREVRRRFPRLRYSLRTLGHLSEAEEWLRQGEIDLAFVPLHPRPPAKIQQRAMARLPLVLLVHPKTKYRTMADVFSQKRLALPLICLPANSGISLSFQQELKRRRIEWPQTLEATSLDLIHRYVANGDGIGLSVQVDPRKKPKGVRLITLDRFPPVTMGAMWTGQLSPAAQATVEGIQAYARRTWPWAACG